MSENKYVVFLLGDERYGLPIERVERILGDQSVTKLPKTPPAMLGVFDLRGETVPAIDLRSRFGMDASGSDRSFVVVSSERGRYALSVDEVDGILTFADEDVEEQPEVLRREDERFVSGVGRDGDRLVVLLDAEELTLEEAAIA